MRPRLFHALAPMIGRDPEEKDRVATTLELLYDLTIVVAFSVGGVQFAHALATGHVLPGLVAFGFVQFATVWAWMNYIWFASAFDTDDWGVRLGVAVQMAGVIIMTAGIPDLFSGFEHGWHLESTTMVTGYVVMRVSMVVMWLRVARAGTRRAHCYANALWTALIQLLWISTCFLDLDLMSLALVAVVLFGLEIGVPVLLWRRFGAMPFHAHHVAERHGLLTIISLGEVVVGTSQSVQVLHDEHGWWHGAAVVLAAGVSITLSLWWAYFSVPFGELLAHRRARAFRFGYLHFFIFAAIAAIGAGLHVAALREEGEATISLFSSVLCVVLPVAVYLLALDSLVVVVNPDPGVLRLRVLVLALAFLALAASLLLAAVGASFATCLAVAMLAPWCNVVGIEVLGHRLFRPAHAS